MFLQPTSIKVSDLEFGIIKEGDYQGYAGVVLKHLSGEKNNGLSLKNPTLENKQNKDSFCWIPKIDDDPFCLYNLCHRQVFEFLPTLIDYDQRILRRKAPQKMIQVSKLSVMCWSK